MTKPSVPMPAVAPTEPTPRQQGVLAALAGKALCDNPFAAHAHESVEKFQDDVEWRTGWWEMQGRLSSARPMSEDTPTRRTDAATDKGLFHDVEVIAAGRDEGTPELSKRVETYRTIAITGMDGDGRREQQLVRRTSDLMKRMSDSGLLSPDEAAAGRKFRADFEIGKLGGLHAPDIRRLPGCGEADLSVRAERARQDVGDAIDALGGFGSPQGQAAWWVLGLQMSLREYSAKKIFGAGRAVDEKHAAGVVSCACAMLMRHYGLEE
jgi:hypothetical protein